MPVLYWPSPNYIYFVKNVIIYIKMFDINIGILLSIKLLIYPSSLQHQNICTITVNGKKIALKLHQRVNVQVRNLLSYFPVFLPRKICTKIIFVVFHKKVYLLAQKYISFYIVTTESIEYLFCFLWFNSICELHNFIKSN